MTILAPPLRAPRPQCLNDRFQSAVRAAASLLAISAQAASSTSEAWPWQRGTFCTALATLSRQQALQCRTCEGDKAEPRPDKEICAATALFNLLVRRKAMVSGSLPALDAATRRVVGRVPLSLSAFTIGTASSKAQAALRTALALLCQVSQAAAGGPA